MSLIGVDMGSSSVKVAVYSEEGSLLIVVNNNITSSHLQPGWWETDPEDVWQATINGLKEIMQSDQVKRDPPKALAVSASGRENFLTDAAGKPLGNNIMGADIRGEEFENPPTESLTPEPWTLSCGHLRERMDPVFRLMWWQKYHPEIVEKANGFPDWHGWLTMRLCGRNVSERSLVGRWAIYDIKTKTWDIERQREFQVSSKFLPEVLPWGTVIDDILPEVVKETGLPDNLKVVVGGHDMNCAAIGSGATRIGMACLISGSYENMLIPTDQYPTASMLLRGLSVTPHLGKIERSIYAVCPTGNAVLNWARELQKVSISDISRQLEKRNNDPSPVMALPYLSGAMLYWENGRKLKGALLGLTLATTPLDIVQAFMESIAYDHINTLSVLAEENVKVGLIRATGGGTRSEWWTKLKSDLIQMPIEVVAQPEPGTFGAALLAGYGIGAYKKLDEASELFSGTSKVYEPNFKRLALHQERFNLYKQSVSSLLENVYGVWG